jgi:DMSO/TMAO reductase YedYZ molybdopterin-dependent catalytic subunit
MDRSACFPYFERRGRAPRGKIRDCLPYDNGDPPQSWWESIDMVDAWHPQTLLAYGMNGPDFRYGTALPFV